MLVRVVKYELAPVLLNRLLRRVDLIGVSGETSRIQDPPLIALDQHDVVPTVGGEVVERTCPADAPSDDHNTGSVWEVIALLWLVVSVETNRSRKPGRCSWRTSPTLC